MSEGEAMTALADRLDAPPMNKTKYEARMLNGDERDLIVAALRLAAEPASNEAREALNLAVNIIMANEPGDSRAVSDEAVALAAVSVGDTSDAVMKVIRAALAAEPGERGARNVRS